MEKFQ